MRVSIVLMSVLAVVLLTSYPRSPWAATHDVWVDEIGDGELADSTHHMVTEGTPKVFTMPVSGATVKVLIESSDGHTCPGGDDAGCPGGGGANCATEVNCSQSDHAREVTVRLYDASGWGQVNMRVTVNPLSPDAVETICDCRVPTPHTAFEWCCHNCCEPGMEYRVEGYARDAEGLGLAGWFKFDYGATPIESRSWGRIKRHFR